MGSGARTCSGEEGPHAEEIVKGAVGLVHGGDALEEHAQVAHWIAADQYLDRRHAVLRRLGSAGGADPDLDAGAARGCSAFGSDSAAFGSDQRESWVCRRIAAGLWRPGACEVWLRLRLPLRQAGTACT